MWRSVGRRVVGKGLGRGRAVRFATVLGFARIRRGRSCRVFTNQRSDPHISAREGWATCASPGDAIRAASAVRPATRTTTAIRRLGSLTTAFASEWFLRGVARWTLGPDGSSDPQPVVLPSGGGGGGSCVIP